MSIQTQQAETELELPQRRVSRMLQRLHEGAGTHPKLPKKCIVVDFDMDPKGGDLSRLEGRILGFRNFLIRHFLSNFEVEGMENRCVRVYFRPERHDLTADQIRREIQRHVVLDQMRFFEIDKAYFFGETLTVEE